MTHSVGGRRVVTLTANDPAYYSAPHSFVLTLGRFTIPALLPVIDPHVTDWMERAHVSVYSTGRVLYVADGSDPDYGTKSHPLTLTLDPLPRPGQFIARPERVE